jgi:hypothetical protein
MFDPFSYVLGIVSLPMLLFYLWILLITVEVAYDFGMLAAGTTVVFAGVGWYFGQIVPMEILSHWAQILIVVGIYILMGIGYMIFKWKLFLHSEDRRVREMIANGKATLADFNPILVKNHKSDIMRWMAWWPFSFVCTLLNDPIRRFFQMIYRYLADFLQAMSDRIFSKLRQEMAFSPMNLSYAVQNRGYGGAAATEVKIRVSQGAPGTGVVLSNLSDLTGANYSIFEEGVKTEFYNRPVDLLVELMSITNVNETSDRTNLRTAGSRVYTEFENALRQFYKTKVK